MIVEPDDGDTFRAAPAHLAQLQQAAQGEQVVVDEHRPGRLGRVQQLVHGAAPLGDAHTRADDPVLAQRQAGLGQRLPVAGQARAQGGQQVIAAGQQADLSMAAVEEVAHAQIGALLVVHARQGAGHAVKRAVHVHHGRMLGVGL